jgi:hypothetical protein
MYIGMTEAYSVAQAAEQMDTNYFGAIRAMQAVLPSMRAAGSGLIINTSSLAGRVSVPFFGTYCATKHALEAYSQSLRYEVAPFGIDVALVEPGPFPSNLLAAGKPPARADVLASYGDLGQVPATMIAGFAQMLASDEAPDPQLVVDAYLSLADAAPGKRPTRTVVGITWGVDEMNAFTQPRQDALPQGNAARHRAAAAATSTPDQTDDNRFVVRGLATGTPVGPFFGVDRATGKSFEIMSIDIVTVEDGLITHIYHLEDWTGAVAQLTAE